MPEKQNPERPRTGFQRSDGDMGVPQKGKPVDDHADDVEQAMESGEPDITGRTRGMVIDKDGTPAGGPSSSPPADDGDYESGRHDAAQT